jgi:hypothetical protein
MPPAYSSAIASLYLSGKQVLVKRASLRLHNPRHSESAVDDNRLDVNDLSVRNNLAIEDGDVTTQNALGKKIAGCC